MKETPEISLEVVSHFLKKFSNEQRISKMDFSTLHYMQAAHMTPVQYAEKRNEIFCKVADVYSESTVNYIFIEGVDLSTCRSFREYWATRREEDVTDIVVNSHLLIWIQTGAAKPDNTNNKLTPMRTHRKHIWNKQYAHAIEVGSSTPSTCLSQPCSRPPWIFAIYTPAASHTRLNSPSLS